MSQLINNNLPLNPSETELANFDVDLCSHQTWLTYYSWWLFTQS